MPPMLANPEGMTWYLLLWHPFGVEPCAYSIYKNTTPSEFIFNLLLIMVKEF